MKENSKNNEKERKKDSFRNSDQGRHSADPAGGSNDFLTGLNVFKFLNENKKDEDCKSPSTKEANVGDAMSVSDDATETITASLRTNDNQEAPLINELDTNSQYKSKTFDEEIKSNRIEKNYDDEEVKRAAAIALAISKSHLSPQEAQQLAGQDQRQKLFLEEAKKKKKQQPGWKLNVNNLQNIIAQTNSALVHGQQWPWPGQQSDQSQMQKISPNHQRTNEEQSGQEPDQQENDPETLASDSQTLKTHKSTPLVNEINNIGSHSSKSADQKLKYQSNQKTKLVVKTQMKNIQHTVKAGQIKAKQKVKEGLKVTSQLSCALPTGFKHNRAHAAVEDVHLDKEKSRANSALSPSGGEQMSNLSKTKTVSSHSEPISLESVVWKRRSGLGKLSTKNPWERRKLALRGSKLIYYALFGDEKYTGENCNINMGEAATEAQNEEQEHRQNQSLENKKLNIWEQAAANIQTATETWNKNLKHLHIVVPSSQSDPNDPRGMMDVIKEQANIYATSGHGGAPTPFVLSIKNGIELKWKFCFDNHEDQMKWLHALTDVVVSSSLQEFEKENDISLEESKKWKMLSSKKESFKNFDINSENDISNSTSVREDSQVDTLSLESIFKLPMNESNRYSVIFLFNLFCVASRKLEPTKFFICIGIVNVAMWLKFSHTEEAIEKGKKEIKDSKKENITKDSKDANDPVASTFKPKAGSTTIMIKKLTDPKSNKEGASFPGWRQISGSSLQVRSKGYAVSKLKRASPGELYECVAVDFCSSDKRLQHFSQRVDIKSFLNSNYTKMNKNSAISCPDLFVVSIAFPTEPPKLTKAETDGKGINVSIFLKMKDETRQILEKIASANKDKKVDSNLISLDQHEKELINGIKLFNEWCRRSPNDPKYQARFKLVPNMINLEELGLPSYISKYNSKPVLIKRAGVTGFLSSHKDADVMEFEISLHPFPYLAKQAFSYLHQSFFSKLITSIGFVVEGRDENELPEVVIGATQLCHVGPSEVVNAKDLFSGQAPSAFD